MAPKKKSRKYAQYLVGNLKGATQEEKEQISHFLIKELCGKDPPIEELRDAVLDDDEEDNTTEAPAAAAVVEEDDDDDYDDAVSTGSAFPATQAPVYLLPQPLSKVNLPVVSIAQHHHIIHLVDVDPDYCTARHVGNSLLNSCTDSSHHYHTSYHTHRYNACKVHIPTSQKEIIYWKPYVVMRSFTLGTFSSYSIFEELQYVQMSHHFIHVHEIYCKDLCLRPQGEPHGCALHPQGDHGCLLLHIKTRQIDNEGFSRASIVVETSSRTFTECKRYGNTNFAHFQHSHLHEHSLYMTLHKDNPPEDPHEPYYDFLTPRDPPQGLPCSPFST